MTQTIFYDVRSNNYEALLTIKLQLRSAFDIKIAHATPGTAVPQCYKYSRQVARSLEYKQHTAHSTQDTGHTAVVLSQQEGTTSIFNNLTSNTSYTSKCTRIFFAYDRYHCNTVLVCTGIIRSTCVHHSSNNSSSIIRHA